MLTMCTSSYPTLKANQDQPGRQRRGFLFGTPGAGHRATEARQRYEETLARHPRAGVAANNLAWLYFQEGRLDEALKLALAAKDALPRAPEVNDTLGWIYYSRGQPLEAIPPLTESVAGRPDYPLYRYHLGLTYWKAGYKDRARTELQAVLEAKTPFAGRDEAARLLKQLPQ